jgi:hypothetical protein
MQKDVDPLPSKGTLHFWKARSKFAAESESVLDYPAVADEPLLFERELLVKSLVNRLENIATTNPVGVLDVHLPRERPVLECDEHLGHGAVGRWFVQLGVGESCSKTTFLIGDFICRKGHIEAEEPPRSMWLIGKQLPV